jgi:hypothetical protein
MPVPYTFATQTSPIPLSELDANFTYFTNAITVSSSKVGINNTSPAYPLDVYDNSNNTGAILGKTVNNASAATTIFPVGVSGWGVTNNAGNTAFGLWGRADLYSTGVATNEVNSFNYYANATAQTYDPPDRSIGTTEILPIALTVAAGGSYSSAIGIQICGEGYNPQAFHTGIYMNLDSYLESGIFIDAPTTGGSTNTAIFRNSGNGINLVLPTMGTAQPNNSVMQVVDSAAAAKFAIKQDGRLYFNTGITQTTVGSTGSASALPANPLGYLNIELAGVGNVVVPYYTAA